MGKINYKKMEENAKLKVTQGDLKGASNLYFKAAKGRWRITRYIFKGVWDQGHWNAYKYCLTQGSLLNKQFNFQSDEAQWISNFQIV